MKNFNHEQFATSAFETDPIDFLREKLTAAHDRCTISVNDKPIVELPTIADALNVMDSFVTKAWDGKTFAAQTPVWSPLFPYWWWEN